eukprot:6172474-Pleurochrysis_carterae.AAC.4
MPMATQNARQPVHSYPELVPERAARFLSAVIDSRRRRRLRPKPPLLAADAAAAAAVAASVAVSAAKTKVV